MFAHNSYRYIFAEKKTSVTKKNQVLGEMFCEDFAERFKGHRSGESRVIRKTSYALKKRVSSSEEINSTQHIFWYLKHQTIDFQYPGGQLF